MIGKRVEPDSIGMQREVRDAYGFAFGLVLVSTLTLVAAGPRLVSPIAALAVAFQLIALVLTLRVSGFQGRVSRLGAYAIGLGTMLVMLGVPLMGGTGRLVGLVAWLVLLSATMAAIARRLVTYRTVTVQLLMGLLVIYMLIGLSFAAAVLLADLALPPGLSPADQGLSGAVYFSFVTLSTLGYGDVVPANNTVRALALAEALVGQLYLVSVVSLAVSRLRQPRPEGTSAGADPER